MEEQSQTVKEWDWFENYPPEVLNKIRKRSSYKLFEQLLEIKERDARDFLRRIYEFLDNYRAFGSLTKADYAFESMNLLLRDIESGEVDVHE